MSTILNDLHLQGIEVIVTTENTGYAVDVKYIKDDGKFEDGEYLAGYTDLKTEEEAEFLARAFIDGYKLGKEA